EPSSLGELIPEQLFEQARFLDSEGTNWKTQTEALAKLANPHIALALEAERVREKNDYRAALAYSQLGKDLGKLMLQSEKINPESIKALANRALALIGKSGNGAREQEIAAAQMANGSEDVESRRLDELAALAKAAAQEKNKRPELTEQLTSLAGSQNSTTATSQSSDLKAQAEELENLAGRESQFAEDEQNARTAFARTEEKIGDNLQRLQNEAKFAAPKMPSPEIASSLEKIRDEATQHARQIKQLGKDASKTAAAPTSTGRLATQAHSAANKLQEQLAQPLA